MGQLSGKRVWITGGGTGIGQAAAEALAAAGAHVVLSGRREAPLEALAERLRAEGGTAESLVLDVADAAAVAAAQSRVGAVDILVASAGLNLPKRSFAQIDTAGWDQIVGVNLNGIFYCVQAVLPEMRERGSGLLVLVSSWAGRYASRLTGPAYNATKRALIALGESINDEEGGHGIRASVVMPGEVATDILKSRPVPPSQAAMDRMLKPEDLGRTIQFLAEMPPHVCINEILISPTWNRFYRGLEEV